jgi:tetratricopeptide (TPR) repeat protein
MCKNNFFIFFLVLSFQLSFAQEQQSILSNSPLTENDQVTEKERKFINLYFEAEKHKILEEYSDAILKYEKCTSILPQESAPYYQIGKLQFYVFHDVESAEDYINKAISLNTSNKWYHYELLSIYTVQNDIEKKLETYYKLYDSDEENEFYTFEIAQLLIQLEEYKKAIRFIKKIEKKVGLSNELLVLEKDIYLAQNNFSAAEKIGKKLIKRSPIFYNTLAEIYMHFSDYENAIITYTELLKIQPNNPAANIALYTIYSNREDLQNQELLLFNIAKSSEINIEKKKEIFYGLIINNNYNRFDSFQEIIESALILHPEEHLFNLILGDLYAREEKLEKAIELYNLSLNSGLIKDDYVYTKLIEIYWQIENFNELLIVTQKAIERFPLSPSFYYYQALVYSQQKKHTLCIESLLKGKDFIFDNDNLLSDFYSLLGNQYHEINDDSSSDSAYDDALIFNPNNIYVLNNYSYYLSNRGEKLSLAKEMIIKCLELTSDNPNPSFIDTYAWILYKLGDYELAKIEIESALLLEKESSVIYDHYGDILFVLGFKEKAVLIWKKALALDKQNNRIMDKINKQL